jgi:hypothetical protein
MVTLNILSYNKCSALRPRHFAFRYRLSKDTIYPGLSLLRVSWLKAKENHWSQTVWWKGNDIYCTYLTVKVTHICWQACVQVYCTYTDCASYTHSYEPKALWTSQISAWTDTWNSKSNLTVTEQCYSWTGLFLSNKCMNIMSPSHKKVKGQ